MLPTASPYMGLEVCAGTCKVSLDLPPALRDLFPDRLKRARRSMERVAACHQGGQFHEEGGAFQVVLPLMEERICPATEALFNRLARQCHAPVLPATAAKRLRIGPQALKVLESRGLKPSLEIPAARHGRRYTLHAFSLGDMDMLAQHLARERRRA